jgi:phosphatidylglycerophosphatase A
LVIETPESAHEISAPPNRVALLIATGAGAGYAPLAPGTFGSALGLVLYPWLAGLGPWLYALTLLALLSLGIWAADEAERVFRRKDDGRIVIDEIVGQLLALIVIDEIVGQLLALAPLVAFGIAASLGWLVTGFVAFRCFDIWKPGPARWAERSFEGGASVMLDDVVAGLLAAVLVGGAAVAAGT